MSSLQIKTKERVKKFAEVYTPDFIVKDMCDLVPTISDIETTVFEPAFGNGNFLVEIYSRKLANCKTTEDVLVAVQSVYGVELLTDNVIEAKERLWQVILNSRIPMTMYEKQTIALVMNLNLQQGNTLTGLKNNGKEILFYDWGEKQWKQNLRD